MANLTLDVVTPYGVTLSDKVDFVSVHGTQGELGILPNHVPFFTSLKIGILTFRKGGTSEFIAVMGGFLEVSNDKVTVLSTSAEIAGDINELRAKEEKDRAEAELMKKAGDVDFARTEKEIQKSLTRLKALEMLEKAGRTRRGL